ncbi:MAG: hypothetical protein HY985_16190 [Magnetospirillum sp.]|nr:hypothetical protein [Magnetospirillum sp.]
MTLFAAIDRAKSQETLTRPPPLPASVTSFLGRLVLLHGVPFPYLVPHETLLPPESLKFFHLDPQWINALVGGALSVARSDDRQALLNQVMDEYYMAELLKSARDARARDRQHSDPARAEADTAAPADGTGAHFHTFTGFLLRSRLLQAWPGVEIEAHCANGTKLFFLRLERLAPDLLFGLADGRIATLALNQPPEGAHFKVSGNQADADRRIDMAALAARCMPKSSAALAKAQTSRRLRFTFTVER